MQPVARARETAEFGYGNEGLDFIDVHGSGILMLDSSGMHFTIDIA
jgi:hypothetical protein